MRIEASGRVTVATGASSHGQGHETSFAQIVADRLGIEPDQVEVISGDTDTGPFGMGTYGSRSLAVGGEAAARAANKVADKAKRIAAHMLEAAPEDIEIRDGRYSVRGSPDGGVTLADVSLAAYVPEDLPEGMEPGLEATHFYDPENFVWPFGAHAAIVEVDVETGKLTYLHYAAVHDAGTVVNPKTLDGQIIGGTIQGLGTAMFEEYRYDQQGRVRNESFEYFHLPSSMDVPSMVIEHQETPSPYTPYGIKGAGEGGRMLTPAVLSAAIEDALAPYGVRVTTLPITPEQIVEWVAEANGGDGAGGTAG